MNTLIIFSSKHGTTEKCAFKLKEKLNTQTVVINVNAIKPDELSKYENIVIGSSIYAGNINKKMLKFINTNIDKIAEKNVFIFICSGIQDEKGHEQIKKVLPARLYESAEKIINFGYEYDFNSLNFFERKIIKLVSKVKESCSCINSDAIDVLAESIKNCS